MKKTLVALAALAVAGGAFAQSTVSLTGEAAFGYQQVNINDMKTSGFGVDTAAVKVSVTEDLGGGMSLTAAMQLANIARGNTVGGEDFTMVVAGGFGKVLMGQIEIGSGIRGLAQAGAPVNNMEGEILTGATQNTIIKYYSPSFGGVVVSGSVTTSTAGMGGGLTALNVDQYNVVTLGADYAAGPLAAKIDVSNYSNTPAGASDNRYRLAASYDLGMVKLGAGYEDKKNNAIAGVVNHVKLTMLGVSAPIGSAMKIGAVWTKNQTDGMADRSGASIGVNYALSKRTSLGAHYSVWDDAGGFASKSNKTWMALDHTF